MLSPFFYLIMRKHTAIAHVLKESLENCYPGRHSLKIQDISLDYLSIPQDLYSPQNRRKSLRKRSNYRTYLYTMYIYFPEISITNENEDDHIIYDYVFKFKFHFLDRISYTDMIVEEISGNSFSMNTLNALSPDYVHSHQNHDRRGFGEFCAGQITISKSVNDLRKIIMRTKNKEEFYEDFQLSFEMFLGQVELFLGWESLAGGPFRRIVDFIYGARKTSIGNEIISSIIKKALTYNSKNPDVPMVRLVSSEGQTKFVLTDAFFDNSVAKVFRISHTNHKFVASSKEEVEEYIQKKVEYNVSHYFKQFNVGRVHIKSKHIPIDREKYCLVEVPLSDIKSKFETVINKAYENQVFEFVKLQEQQIPSLESVESSTFSSFRRA